MSHKKSLGLLAAAGLAGLVVASCGSSNSSGGDDSGTIQHKDGGEVIVGTGDAGEAAAAIVADGTTGKPCTSDADCSTPTGPGINKCSLGTVVSVNGVSVQLLPTPVCKIPFAGTGNCDPAPPGDLQGMGVHYCDGPDSPNSPGICIPGTATPMPNLGVCEVHCKFRFDGSAPTGCTGKDTCVPYYFSTDPTTQAVIGGGGFCQGSCEQDADCSALGTGWVCQTDLGFCTQHKVVRKKQIGQACSQSTTVNDQKTGACNCQLVNSTTSNGYCTSACVVGGAPCANGWICDNLSAAALPDGTSVLAENIRTPGFCVPGCSGNDGGVPPVEAGSPTDAAGALDGATDAAVDAGGAVSCPPNSTCQPGTPAGPDCLP